MRVAGAGAKLAELSARYALPARGESALRTLLSLLSEDPRAPTTIREPRAVIDDHLADSLVALELDEVRGATTIADIGSGAGLPGLALAAALPEARVWLIEANRNKCVFIERARTACGLENAHAVNVRAELWAEGRGRCELVTARAVGALPVVAEYAAPLLATGGVLLAWRGARTSQEDAAGERAASALGLQTLRVVRVFPHACARHRHLHLMLKVRSTPSRFPRRPGAAAKRPLGAAP